MNRGLKAKLIAGKVIRPTDIVEWNPNTVTEPNYAAMTDGQYFWLNPDDVGLRNAFHWSGTQYSVPTIGGKKRLQFSVNPTVPDNTVAGHWNYRAEVTRDWESGYPLGTRDCVGWGLDLPAGALKNHDEDIDFFQWHAGSYPGEPSNDPAIYGVISRAGTEDDNDDVAQLNEIVVVNKVRDWEQSGDPNISGRINTGIVIANGERHEFYMELISGVDNDGYFVLWHCEETSPGVFSDWTKIYEATESTAWPTESIADAGSNPNVHPDWKVGIYCPGIRDQSGAEAEEALNGGAGTYSITLPTPGIRNLLLLADHPFRNKNVMGFLETTDMP